MHKNKKNWRSSAYSGAFRSSLTVSSRPSVGNRFALLNSWRGVTCIVQFFLPLC
mgnify:CR=1 FL=1